jgi:hypothetical protein
VRNLKLRADEAEITHCVTGLQFRSKDFYPLLVRQLSAIAFRCGITKLFMMTSSNNHASQPGIEKAGLQRRGSIRRLRLLCLSAHASLTWRGHRSSSPSCGGDGIVAKPGTRMSKPRR